jgi:hypothetical protein
MLWISTSWGAYSNRKDPLIVFRKDISESCLSSNFKLSFGTSGRQKVLESADLPSALCPWPAGSNSNDFSNELEVMEYRIRRIWKELSQDSIIGTSLVNCTTGQDFIITSILPRMSHNAGRRVSQFNYIRPKLLSCERFPFR